MCKDINGVCITHRDGYYAMSALCMILGVILLVGFIIPKALKLQGKSHQQYFQCTGADGPCSSPYISMASEDGLI